MSTDREHPMPGQQLRSVPDLGRYGREGEGVVVDDLTKANLVTSVYVDDDPPSEAIESWLGAPALHRPILDIDFPAQLLPSSTHGHHHLYLDVPMHWERYRRLLLALGEAGVIEHGYARASVARGYSAVRLPWVTKETERAKIRAYF